MLRWQSSVRHAPPRPLLSPSTQAGYVGEDVESVLHKLYVASGQNLEATQARADAGRGGGGPACRVSDIHTTQSCITDATIA